mgnify:CR=1 FL=1
MGWNRDDLFFLAYWYPQMAVLDDVIGWHVEPFRGGAEFYSGFASYDITIDLTASKSDGSPSVSVTSISGLNDFSTGSSSP